MTAKNSGIWVGQEPSVMTLWSMDDARTGLFRGTPEQVEAVRSSLHQANVGSHLVNIRFSVPWQAERIYIALVLYRGHRPSRFPHHAERLRSADPVAISFWHHIPASILVGLSATQAAALDRMLKPLAWQKHPWDWRGACAWGQCRYAFRLVAGPERRSRDRRLTERAKHPLWTSANAAFLLALQLPFLLVAGLGLGAVLLRPQLLVASQASDRAYQRAITASLRDPVARNAYLSSDLPRLRDRLHALGVESTIRDRHPRPLTDREYEQLVVRTFHQHLTFDVRQRDGTPTME